MDKGSRKISMDVETFDWNRLDQLSPVYHINGYPWRLRLFRRADGQFELFVRCEKSKEAELWECTASIALGGALKNRNVRDLTFTSWTSDREKRVGSVFQEFAKGSRLEVEIKPDKKGEIWTRRSVLDPLKPHDAIFVIGDNREKVYVHKQSLVSQSPYFDRLFNGDFKEKSMAEIPIRDVEYEEFINIFKIIHGIDGSSLTDDQVPRILQLADRFELKIVQDRTVNFLLSSACSLSLHKKMVYADMYKISFPKELLIASKYNFHSLKELTDFPEWNQLSRDTLRSIVRSCCDDYFC